MYCNSLASIVIPESVTSISNTAFQECRNVVIICPEGSAAETYAKKLKKKYQNTEFDDTESIEITPVTVSLSLGETKELTLKITPETARQTAYWTSSNEGVATVDQSGKVTAVAEGTAVITATSKDNEEIKATCTITVTKKEETVGDTPGSTTPETPGATTSDNTTGTNPGTTTSGNNTQTTSTGTTGSEGQNSKTPAKANTTLQAKTNKCTVKVVSADTKNPTVSYVKSTNAKAKTITVPDTVTVDGVTYKVVSVADNAVQKNKKVTTITLGKNVTSIGNNAFKGCTSLKTVNIKSSSFTKIGANAFSGDKKLTTVKLTSTKLTSKSVGKNAFKGTNKKLTIKVPKKKVSSYKKYFKNKGNKTLKVKKG
jgi:hypothetical protein